MHFYPPQPINHIGTAKKAFWVLSWLTPGFPGVISCLKGIEDLTSEFHLPTRKNPLKTPNIRLLGGREKRR